MGLPTTQEHKQQGQGRWRRRDCCPRPLLGQQTLPLLNSSSGMRRRRSSIITSLSLLFAACACWCGRTAAAAAGSNPSSLTLRVRMPDGAVKRVKATATDTVDGIMAKLGMDGGGGAGGGEGLSTDASGSVAAGSASVAALGLGNGDFLFVQSDSAARSAAKAKLDALGRMKAAVAGGKAHGGKFVPFPDQARPPPPRATKRIKNWQDIEAMQAQTFSLKPQKDSNVKKISVEQSAMDDFVGYLKQTGLGRHRCALLFGRVNPSTKGIRVEAMYEPPQQQQGSSSSSSSSSSSYDSSSLMEASRVAVAAMAGKDGAAATAAASETCETGGAGGGSTAAAAAAQDVARAVRVAELLGLRLVGWCLSHDKREHFMAATDVVTASALQLMSMAEKGKEEGVLLATVTLPVNTTNGEVATEAFSVSNQTVQMFSEEIFVDHQPDPIADRVTTTVVVKEGGKETQQPETLGLICNVAIVQHEGVLQTSFPRANRARVISLSDLKEKLFGTIGPQNKIATGATKKRQTQKKQPSFLKRLSDFQLLVYLSRQMGFSRDFEELCAVVQKRDSKSPALDKLKVVLENLCDA
ncbi:unnamed protein product [Pylaiella littoralis]